jgi:TonB family protein
MGEVNSGAGAILRTARERQGRDTASIAQELGILQRYVVAMERDDLKDLPGGFYYKSFVRQYAAIVGVNEIVIQPGIYSLLETGEPLPVPRTNPNQPAPADPIVREVNRSLADSHLGAAPVALIAIVVATSGLYAWYEHSLQTAPAARITAATAEQVRLNFPAAAANPPLGNRQATVAPAVFQSALKPVKPLVISAPPEPDANALLPAALFFPLPPRKSRPHRAGVLHEEVVRDPVVHRVLPEIPVEARGTIRGKATVVVSVVANQSGDVTEANVEESDSPLFDRLATEASAKWRFLPSKTVSSREYLLRFEITGTGSEATLQESAELRQPKEP